MVPAIAVGVPPPKSRSKTSSPRKKIHDEGSSMSSKSQQSSDDEDESNGSSSSEEDDDKNDQSESGSEGDIEVENDDVKDENPVPLVRSMLPPVGPSDSVDENSPLGILRGMVEVAQICNFLKVFGRILKIPSISRTELENALVDGESSPAYPQLIEVFYRVCRDAGQKIEKARMAQEWERVVQRKLSDNWQRDFNSNPMTTAFKDVPIRDRALILNALCEWRLATCADITKYITTITTPTKDVKDASAKFELLRPEALGRDDKGCIYWYFNDGCWVYAEDMPSTLTTTTPYHVRYSDPSKIRLSTHYALENNFGMDSIHPSIISDDRKRKRKSSKKESKSSHRKESSKRKKEHAEDSSHAPTTEDTIEPPPEPPSNDPPPPQPEIIPDDPEDRQVLCSMCKKFYDMSLLDPPLLKKPQGEWKCFECLVNDCRGWPRRRPSRKANPPPPPKVEEVQKKEHKKKKKSSKKSSSKKSSSSSSKKSSSKKKSSKRHSSSYPEEYKYLLDIYQTRKRQREEAHRASLENGMPPHPSGPARWRVISASVADLKAFLAREFEQPGSVQHERLKGRLIQILKAGEAFEEEQTRLRLLEQQQMVWQTEALPRRASSRVALERLKSQSGPEYSKSDDESWENKPANDRAQRLSRRTSVEATNGLNPIELEERNKRRLAMERAHRASRRQREWDGSSSDEEETIRQTRQTTTKDWISWKAVHSNSYPLRAVCCALVSRLMNEEMAALFSRPVNPLVDGCPDYHRIVKHPMDLGTVKARSLDGHYTKWGMFKEDMNLIWSNCRLYNSEGALIVQYANTLEKIYRNMIVQAEEQGVDDMKEDEKETSEEEYNKNSTSSSESSQDNSTSSSSSDSDQRRTRTISSRSKSIPKQKKTKSTKYSGSSDSDQSIQQRQTRNFKVKTIESSSDSSEDDIQMISKPSPQSPPPPPLPPSPPPPIPVVDPPSDSSSSSYFSSSEESD